MRKNLLFFLGFIFLLNSSFNPAVSDQPLSKVDRLYYTCKVWGFLKYYHSKVGTGAYDWDQKLLGVLRNTEKIETSAQLSTYLSRWIYAFGPRKKCNSCNQKGPHEDFKHNFDLSWIQADVFSDELKSTFLDIERNRFSGDHFYIGKGKNGQFEPKNESKLLEHNWKDENERLLTLFRYWNYVEYFYPYKYLTDQPWDDVLKDMIPKFLSTTSKLDYHKALLEMVVKTDDSYAGLVSATLDKMPYYNYLPARFEMIEGQAVVTEIVDTEKAKAEDLEVGDVITTVNGQSVKSLHESHLNYIWGSNPAVKERSIYHTLFMGLTAPPTVTILKGNTKKTKQLTLYKYSELSYAKRTPTEKWYTAADSVGYVNLSRVRSGDVDTMMEEMMQMAVIIFDLRDYPKVSHRAISKFLNSSDTTFALYVKPNFSYPGKFAWAGSASSGRPNAEYYKGKVILLVDENTQGHAEFTCMSLRSAPDVMTIGSQTAGTNGAVSKFLIYGQLVTSFTGTGVYYPDRRKTQRMGIIPDIEVKRTIEGIRAGRDEVLDKALEVAKEEVTEKIRIAREMKIREMDSLSMARDSLVVDSLSLYQLEVDSLSTNDDGKN